jgi:hypothetical protein
MGWWLYLIFAIILASIIAGQSSAPSGTTGTNGTKNCTPCEADFAWYAGLKWWQQGEYSAWYAARWAACKANGC